MAPNRTIPWEALVKWSATAFVLAGLFRLINMIVYQSGVLLTSFTAPELALDVSLFFAFELAFVGLLGLYPRLKEERPRLALAGACLAVISGVSLLVITSAEYVIGGEEPPAYLVPFQVAYFLGIPLSLLVMGGTSVRARIPSLRIGVLLVVGGASWVALFTGMQTLIDLAGFLFAAVMLAVGYLLHTKPTESSHAEPASDVTAR